jgi:predicted nucleic acid-binding protein
MRVLLDTDIVLDVIAERVPFAAAASQLLDFAERSLFEAYISGITPINIFYIARKAKSGGDLRRAIEQLLRAVRVCPVDHAVLVSALSSPIVDYEDAVQHASAVAGMLDAIVTRNLDDYKNAALPVYSPADFLDHLKAQT